MGDESYRIMTICPCAEKNGRQGCRDFQTLWVQALVRTNPVVTPHKFSAAGAARYEQVVQCTGKFDAAALRGARLMNIGFDLARSACRCRRWSACTMHARQTR